MTTPAPITVAPGRQTFATTEEFLDTAHPGEEHTEHDSRAITTRIMVTRTDHDKHGREMRGGSVRTITTRHHGPAQLLGHPARCYRSLTTVRPEHSHRTPGGYSGRQVEIDLTAPSYVVGQVDGVARFSRRALEAAHAAAVSTWRSMEAAGTLPD